MHLRTSYVTTLMAQGDRHIKLRKLIIENQVSTASTKVDIPTSLRLHVLSSERRHQEDSDASELRPYKEVPWVSSPKR